MERWLPVEVQVMVPPSWVREGVSHGSGRSPSAWSYGECARSDASHGA